ncbi:MAG: hypothetical protein ACNA8W_16255 [Bradymonadaceae bacterium]
MMLSTAVDSFPLARPLSVAPVLNLRDRLEFIRLPRRLYADDPHYRCLPDLLVYEQLHPRRNPWFEHGRAQLFIARRGDEVVGRISAHIDFEHLRLHDDETGFFGFFECEDDPAIARILLQVAQDWCRTQGMKSIRGPFSFSINEECGTLVEGFDTPNYVMMAHGRPYYPEFLESHGFEGAMDLLAWRYVREHPPEHVQQIADAVAEHPGLVVRKLDMDNLDRDVRIIMDVFNDAWSNNWGFVPLTRSEVDKVVEDFRRIADPEICLIAEVTENRPPWPSLCPMSTKPSPISTASSFPLVGPAFSIASRSSTRKLFGRSYLECVENSAAMCSAA